MGVSRALTDHAVEIEPQGIDLLQDRVFNLYFFRLYLGLGSPIIICLVQASLHHGLDFGVKAFMQLSHLLRVIDFLSKLNPPLVHLVQGKGQSILGSQEVLEGRDA